MTQKAIGKKQKNYQPKFNLTEGVRLSQRDKLKFKSRLKEIVMSDTPQIRLPQLKRTCIKKNEELV